MSVPFSVTVAGQIDFVIESLAPDSGAIVSVTVIGVIPPPSMTALLVIESSVPNGAN